TIGATAGDSIVAVDGVALRRSVNTITDLLPGIRLDLVSASVGTQVSINSAPPVESLRQTVNDVVDAINELQASIRTETDPVTGPLRADPGARSLVQSLRELTLRRLLPSTATGPATLAEIGVRTNRDGSLSVDAARLSRVLTENPEAVEAMFASIGGLGSEINRIAVAASSRVTGLGASEQRYTREQTRLSDEQADALEEAEATRVRMTQQFASMDARVAAYRQTQTYLQQQIDSWNADRN
ncbi:flagellar filament capping protein FliD, partial [Sphingomonas sp. CCH20-B6]